MAVGWFYKWWVLPIAAVTWFGVALLVLLVYWPLGILAFLIAGILFEGLLSYRGSEQPSPRSDEKSAQ